MYTRAHHGHECLSEPQPLQPRKHSPRRVHHRRTARDGGRPGAVDDRTRDPGRDGARERARAAGEEVARGASIRRWRKLGWLEPRGDAWLV